MVLAMIPNDTEAKRLYVIALNSYGIELGTAGQHGKAADMFRQSLALEPDSRSVRHNLATALLDGRDPGGAAQEARAGLENHPQDAGFYNLLGRALAVQGQFTEALANLEAAVKLRPEDPALREDLLRLQRFVRP